MQKTINQAKLRFEKRTVVKCAFGLFQRPQHVTSNAIIVVQTECKLIRLPLQGLIHELGIIVCFAELLQNLLWCTHQKRYRFTFNGF